MGARRVASVVLVLAGGAWVAAGALGRGSAPNAPAYLAGLVLGLLGLAVLGYSLVGTAPVWLRAVVTVATPALGYMVWATVKDAFVHDSVPVAVAGLLLAVAGATGWGPGSTRGRRGARKPATRGRRAAR